MKYRLISIICCLGIAGAARAEPVLGLQTELERLKQSEHQALKREQQGYLNRLSTPLTAAEQHRLKQRLDHQRLQHEQLQQQQRAQSISGQQRSRGLPKESATNPTRARLPRFRRAQQAHRLNQRILRRTWPYR